MDRPKERQAGARMSKVEGTPFSKYQMINQILSARKLDKHHEVRAGTEALFPPEDSI